MDEDWENKLKEKKLPDIKYFHTSLNNTKCSTDDYHYAKEIYKYFTCKETTDYNDLYVITGLLLLADVFTSYRKKMYEIYGLDSLCCTSAPGFSNREMLKMTNIENKLVTNVDMHLMIENGIRAGRCESIYYHAKANNKYVDPNFNKEKESCIISLDENSLYASAMCYKLPYGETKFDHTISNYTTEYILNLNPYGQHLFVFVVDIHYPKKFHDRDFEFPILCDQSVLPNDKTKKLMSTFHDKKNYTISLHMLKYCLEKGLESKKKQTLCDICRTI